MELKQNNTSTDTQPWRRLNRTFMELKQSRSEFFRRRSWCLNRTFMELKHTCVLALRAIRSVLIVPLWN